jgi:hypothetical protein
MQFVREKGPVVLRSEDGITGPAPTKEGLVELLIESAGDRILVKMTPQEAERLGTTAIKASAIAYLQGLQGQQSAAAEASRIVNLKGGIT